MKKTQKWHQFALFPRPGANLRNVWHSFPRGRHPPPTIPQQTNPQIGYWQVALFIAPQPALSFFAVCCIPGHCLFSFWRMRTPSRLRLPHAFRLTQFRPERGGRVLRFARQFRYKVALWWIAVRKSVVNFPINFMTYEYRFFRGVARRSSSSVLPGKTEKEKWNWLELVNQTKKSQQK